jgi:outer membrane protein OmpA-like peptidoglycan-associated protein
VGRERTPELLRPPRALPEVARVDDPATETAARTGTVDPARLRAGEGRHRLHLGPGRPAGRGWSRHGVDLSEIRVHDDAASARLAEAHGARAVAVGRDIAFARGELRPGTVAGDALLDHEVAHVAQQARAGVAVLQRQGRPGEGPGRRPPREPFDRVTDGSLGTEDDHILFERDSIGLPTGFEERFRGLLGQHQGAVTVELHGYASEDGDVTYNLNLSAQRAATVGRVVESWLPSGSVVRLIAHGVTSGFGDRPEDNRRLGIDLTDRVPFSQALGWPAPPPSPFGIPELTVDTRILPFPGREHTVPRSSDAPVPDRPANERPLDPNQVLRPKVTFVPDDPNAVGSRLLGPGAAPYLPRYGPYTRVLPTLQWGPILTDVQGRGVRLTTGDEEIIARHYTLYFPLAEGLYRLGPVRLIFDSPADVMNTMTRRMVNQSLLGSPTSFERLILEDDRLRSILGEPPPTGLTIPVFTKEF